MDTQRELGRGEFAASRRQLHRMAAIVSLLKMHAWVQMADIRQRLDETEFGSGAYLGCGNRTVQRTIKILQEEYHAPIEYSKRECAYRLYDQNWSFQIPALLSPDELLAIMLGGKVASDVFPPCVSSRVSRAVAEVLRNNASDELTPELVESLKILPNAVAVVPDSIFELVFEAWRLRRVLRINYVGKDGTPVLRDIEPHTLVFHDMHWSIKGICRLRCAVRTFHLSRVNSAVILDETFTPSRDIIDSVTPDQFLDFQKVKDVTIRLTEAGYQYARCYALHSKQSFIRNDDGSYLMFVPAVSLERLVPWVLRLAGEAVPLSPVSAVRAVHSAIRRLTEACQAF